jgi:hypothetical protein
MDPGTEDILQSQANRDPSTAKVGGGSGGLLPVGSMDQVGCSDDLADPNCFAYGSYHVLIYFSVLTQSHNRLWRIRLTSISIHIKD